MPWPGEIESVTVTWMDGKQETCPCTQVQDDGAVLKVSTVYRGSIGFSDHVSGERCFPLASVRAYSVNRVT